MTRTALSRPGLFALAMISALLLPSAASATNGYLIHGIGTRAKGLAGAGVALPQDALAPATNPAGLAMVGKRYDAGVGLFSPRRNYTIQGNPSGFPGTVGLAPGKVDSDSELFFVPNFGAAWKYGARSAVGLAVYGQGGMNTDYPTATFFFSQPTGVDLSQMFIVPTWATRLGSGSSAIGISPIIAAQFFEAQGLQLFAAFSSDPANLTNRDHDESFGFGARVGYYARLTDRLAFGAAYQTEIKMDEFSSYAGLFAGGGDFDIPSNWTAGIAYKLTPSAVLAIDYQEIAYSDIGSVGNPLFPALGRILMGDPNARLGADQGPGFGWEDMEVVKVGFQWGGGPWVWRLGFSTGDQPIPPTEVLFNILAPGVVEDHYTVGFTRALGSGAELNFALMHAPSVSVAGPNPLEAPGQQTIALEMDQWDLEVGFSWGF